MISEKFESLAPGNFLDGLSKMKESKKVLFIGDFEYSEEDKFEEDQLVFVGRFHHLEKKWKNKKNVEFLELHNQSQIPQSIDSVKFRVQLHFLEGLIKNIESHQDQLIEVSAGESFLGGELFKSLSKYFLVNYKTEDLVSRLGQEFKKQGIESISNTFTTEDALKLEQILDGDDIAFVKEQSNHLWIPVLIDQQILQVKLSGEIDQRDLFDLYTVFFRLFNLSPNDAKAETFTMEEPLVVLTETSDIFHSNESFRKLNVERRLLTDLKNGEIVPTNDQNYLAIVVDQLPVEKELKVILFFRIESQNSEVLAQGNDEELGIICSSIAHELNNPIGGILNAFQLLQVMNDYDGGTIDMFSEMTKSINRAHRLVNLFLGFVKKDITRKENVQIDVTLNQAVDLLRGRMIKEGFFIHLESVFSGENPNKSFNESILIIIFYILFNESLTAFARETLVKETSQDEKTLFLVTTISKSSISIQYKNISQRVSHPLDSHLLKYLLKSQELQVIEREKEIEFTWA